MEAIDPVTDQSSTIFTLSGYGGSVTLHAGSCNFLRNASEHTSQGTFAVPFSIDALHIVAYACRANQPSANVRCPWQPDDADAFEADIEHRLETVSFELLFEVLRAANYLEFDGLLSLVCRVVGHLLCAVRTEPTILSSIVGLPPHAVSVDGPEQAACADEPVLTPPAMDELPADALLDEPFFHDEDALALCLLECDAATLRVLKGLSPAWRQRARVALCDGKWQRGQVALDLDWALGTDQPSLENKRWACCASLCAVLPNLAEMTLLGTKVDLNTLKGGHTSHRTLQLDARLLRSATWHVPQGRLQYDGRMSSACAPEELANASPSHVTNRHASLMAKGRLAVQISAAIWLIAHSPCLQHVDLSGIVPQLCSNWPVSTVRAIAAAVRTGAPHLRSLILIACDLPILSLRTPTPFRDPADAPPEAEFLPGLDMDMVNLARRNASETLNLEGASLCVADLLVLCNAADEMPHIEELLLSSNHFGNEGLMTLLDEVPPHVSSAVTMPRPPRKDYLLPHLRWLALNDCHIGDAGVEHLARAMTNGAFSRLLQLCLVSNRIGDAGLGALANAAVDFGAFASLAHLNVGSNEITDLGVVHLAGTLRCGALPGLIHLSFGLNQIGNAAVVALSSATADAGCLARLEYLGLGANKVGNEGARALARAMGCSPGLARLSGLWIADNAEITDEGAIALAEGLCQSHRLRELYLHGLSIQNEGIEAFVRAIYRLPELRRCVIGRASPDALRRIEELQRSMRQMHNRDDIVISSWPQLEGGVRRRPDRSRRPRVHSTLRMHHGVP